MSNVIIFEPDRRSKPTAAAAQPGAAQILFFTGVRYVRDVDHAAEAGDKIPAAAVLAKAKPLQDTGRLQA